MTLIISRDSEINVLRAMEDRGGGFVSHLGRAGIESDTPGAFAQALAKLAMSADATNREKLFQAFPAMREIFALSPADRYTRLRDAFPGIWAEYAAIATRKNTEAAGRTWAKSDRHLRAAWASRARVVEQWDLAGVVNIVDTEWGDLEAGQQQKLADFHGGGSVVIHLKER